MYEVIHFFTDLQDFNHAYNVGDEYPRQGMAASEARLKELSGKNNKQKKPLIRLVQETAEKPVEGTADIEPQEEAETAPVDADKAYTKTDINRMPKEELVKLAMDKGIENASELSGNDLKARLINILGL